jgi:hypothetical protein
VASTYLYEGPAMKRRLGRGAVILAAILTGLSVSGPARAAAVTLTPATTWYDTSGQLLQAHGAGVFKVGSTYYLVGEDKTAGASFTAVACYSSTDLAHWTRQANALSQQGSGDLAAGRIVERPKVIYNSTTGRYVMWMHIDSSSYGDARAGVATSSTPCGPYTYLGSSRPLGFVSRDLGLFKDDDGTGYLLTEDRVNGLRIDRLSADYTTVQSATAVLTDLEAPAMVKVAGRYFLLASHLSGWAANDNVYATATSLSGPWSGFTDFAPAGSNTYTSQTSFVLPVSGSAGTSYVYLGDRWNSGALNSSLPIWLPLTIIGSTATLGWHDSWTIDTATGSWSAANYRLVGNQSGRCLDVTGNVQTNGALAEIWDCNGGANQQWTPTGSNELRVYGSKCLDASNQGTTTGTAVDIYDCNGGNNQKWTLGSDGTIHSVQSGLCLDVNGASSTGGTKLILWTCTGGTNQKWTRG